MNYDICDPEIRCNADKEGATIFEVHTGRRLLRVLTFDQKRAHEIVRDEEETASTTPSDDSDSWLF